MNQLITLFLIIGSFQVLVAQNSNWSSIYGKMQVLDVVERNNELWVASNIGLFQVDKTTLQSQHYTTKNSLLPNNHIQTLSVDQAQNLWIGTYDLALLKVTPNTQTWTTINYPTSIGAESLNDNKIYTSAVDPTGTIWLGTKKGLISYNGTNWNLINNVPVWDLEINSHGILKVGSLFLFSYNTATNEWTKHGMPSDTNKILAYGDCRLLTPNDSTCFYFSEEITFGGVHKIVNNTQWTSWGQTYTPSSQLLPTKALPGDNWNLQLRTTPNGTVYYNLSSLSSDLLGYYDGQNWQIDNNINKQAASINKIEHFFISNNGDFWLFEENKMVCYNGASYKKATLAPVHFDPLSSIVSDKDANIYLTNYSNGIKKKNATTWTTLVGSDNFQVKHVKFDHNNKAWFTSRDANGHPIIVEQSNQTSAFWIVHDHSSTSNIFPLRTNSHSIHFVDLVINTNNSILVRDNRGNIYVCKNNQWTKLVTNTNNYTWYSSMTADKLGNIWWIENNSNTSVMKKYDDIGVQQFNLPPNTQSSTIYADEDGNIWTFLITDKISKFDGINWTNYTCPLALNNHIINITGKDGVLFIATHHDGLFRYEHQVWTNYRTNNSPLTSNNLMNLVFDKDGKLWIQNNRNNIIDIFDTNPTSTTSIDAIPQDTPSLFVFPNPATQYIQIETSLKNIETAQIVNSMGQTMLHLSPSQKTIDISTLTSGIYWALLKNKKTTKNQAFIKQ